MKKLYLLLILCAALTCDAQFKPVVISDAAFDPNFETAALSKLNGWYCRFGNDTAWAKNDSSSAGWQKLGPMDLSAKYAGKNGKVECWFRITLKLDPSLKKTGYNILYSSFAPADIYINGKRIGSVGNTGLYGHPYSEYYAEYLGEPAIHIPVKNGEQFTLTLHLVDTLAPILPGKIKSQLTSFVDVIYLSSARSNQLIGADYFNLLKSYTIWLSASTLLSLLFWLLVIQNRGEKVFLYIAVWSTLTAFRDYSSLRMYEGVHSLAYVIFHLTSAFTFVFTLVSVPVILAEIFKRRLLTWVKIVLAILPANVLFTQFSPSPPFKVLGLVGYIFLITLSVYYIISSWKRLRGAQWSVVAGLLGFFFLIIVVAVVITIFRVQVTINNGAGYYLFTAAILIFPVSLLVFVAMRFKEILHEVKQNAHEVVRLSEEKKEEALNRQRLLQEEVDRQTAEIRANQARLVQSEKMASLGELTAGIAHEIQNPLNFVNNFSEVSVELLEELKAENEKPKAERDEQLATELITDLAENANKINLHGKRAGDIVKSMLEHSRASTGNKEPTDLNKLADEYMRLSYHGLRSKDKSFNAEMVTHFDTKLPLINVIPQDIGRVFINLFNNAFYAVNQKQKSAAPGYKPQISVTTTSGKNSITIKVNDNGNGIPDVIKDKIMQPFFTTKPTGEGTGLGLSLTYDIVVKGHSGKIDVHSKEGGFTEFTVSLPL